MDTYYVKDLLNRRDPLLLSGIGSKAIIVSPESPLLCISFILAAKKNQIGNEMLYDKQGIGYIVHKIEMKRTYKVF